MYQLLAQSAIPDNKVGAQIFLYQLNQAHPELMTRLQRAFGLVHQWILELQEAALSHGDPLFAQYFPTGKTRYIQTHIHCFVDGDEEYRKQLQGKYQEQADALAPITAHNISTDGVDRVLIGGEYISVPDIQAVEYNRTFFAQAGVPAALMAGPGTEHHLCMNWINFGFVGGAIFTVGMLGGMLLQSLFARNAREGRAYDDATGAIDHVSHGDSYTNKA